MWLGRYEFKYIITKELADLLKAQLMEHLVPEKFCENGDQIISSLYFDNSNYELYHQTYNRDPYRVKLRLRVYGEKNSPDSLSFFETKSKLLGRSVKQRVKAPLGENMALAAGQKEPFDYASTDIANLIKNNNLKPTAIVSYDRLTLVEPGTRFRIAFDHNLRIRTDDLDLTHGTYGTSVMDDDLVILEVKGNQGMPVWVSKILSKYKLSNQGYSKYGQIGLVLGDGSIPAVGKFIIPFLRIVGLKDGKAVITDRPVTVVSKNKASAPV